MKRYLLLLFLAVTLLAEQSLAREVHNINRDWKFFSDTETTSDAAQQVNLPHIWNNDALSGKQDYFRGVGNYLKDIEVPYSWQGKRIFIKFYGANSVTNLMVNGVHVGQHHGGYTAFVFELTDYIRYGVNNTLWAIVNNSPRLDVLPTAGDANVYGGIFRDVELIVTNQEVVIDKNLGASGVKIIEDIVSEEQVKGSVSVEVNALSKSKMKAQIMAQDHAGETVLEQDVSFETVAIGAKQVVIPFTLNNPRLWRGTDDPYLYNFYVKIYDQDDFMCDSVMVRTGFRSYSIDKQQGFVLNGEPYPIKGVYVTQDRATNGPALTIYQILEDVNLIKEMGANMVRVVGVPHNNNFYELCDEYGILVWSDMPLVGPAYLTDIAYINTEEFKQNGRDQLREIISQQYNHPSVAMWGIFSQLKMVGDSPLDYVRELNTLAKNEDPSRMTIATSEGDGEINFITDLIVWDHSFGWKMGRSDDITIWLEQLNSSWSNLNSAISYRAGASIFHQEDALSRPDYAGNWHPERWQTNLHQEYFALLDADTTLWGQFVFNMFDYGAVARSWGEGLGINDFGLVTFDRKYNKDAFYFYKANWNKKDPFVYLAERRWMLRSSLRQQIKVFSNQEQVDIYVNGELQAQVEPSFGTFIWNYVELKPGRNIIEARSGSLSDRIELQISGTEDIAEDTSAGVSY